MRVSTVLSILHSGLHMLFGRSIAKNARKLDKLKKNLFVDCSTASRNFTYYQGKYDAHIFSPLTM